MLLVSGVSQRRAALILRVTRPTIVKHFRFLAGLARLEHEVWLKRYKASPLDQIQFDDLETSVHTKLKPMSVALAIDPVSRKILSIHTAQMPARGHISEKAKLKYGRRKDLRPFAWNQMMKDLIPIVKENAIFTSDENPHYPKFLKRHHNRAVHIQVNGGRGCITGQGELKQKRFDPIFALNHTCAMLRANLNRLFRKTWCTTKNEQGLQDHLALFVSFFNQGLYLESAVKEAS